MKRYLPFVIVAGVALAALGSGRCSIGQSDRSSKLFPQATASLEKANRISAHSRQSDAPVTLEGFGDFQSMLGAGAENYEHNAQRESYFLSKLFTKARKLHTRALKNRQTLPASLEHRIAAMCTDSVSLFPATLLLAGIAWSCVALPDRASLRCQARLMQPGDNYKRQISFHRMAEERKTSAQRVKSSKSAAGVINGRRQLHTVCWDWHNMPHRFKKRCEDAFALQPHFVRILTSASAGVIRDQRVFS